jgi:hypothetical protein
LPLTAMMTSVPKMMPKAMRTTDCTIICDLARRALRRELNFAAARDAGPNHAFETNLLKWLLQVIGLDALVTVTLSARPRSTAGTPAD